MQAISIAESLWLEPTLLGVTLNYSEKSNNCHYRVGIGFRSLGECDHALAGGGAPWILQDKSLMIQGNKELTLTFCPGTHMERQCILTGDALEIFRRAIHFLALASEPQKN
jgi:hypothetical protein